MFADELSRADARINNFRKNERHLRGAVIDAYFERMGYEDIPDIEGIVPVAEFGGFWYEDPR